MICEQFVEVGLLYCAEYDSFAPACGKGSLPQQATISQTVLYQDSL
jgi:hypothetical protein